MMVAALGLIIFAGRPAAADTIYSFTTGGNGNANQAGTAVFDFTDANHFTITLVNTGNIVDISGLLDGISFTESGTVTGITLNSISAEAQVLCISTGCTDSNPGSQPATDWTAANTGSNVTVDAGGTGTFHPSAVVNDTIDTNFALDGLTNGQHNPNLEGPVVFTLTTTGETSIPTLSNVVEQFGTTPDNITLQVTAPEPSVILLLGLGLVSFFGLGLFRK
jgi:hypothetical protein